jgi:hypothetical protein
VSSHFNEVHTLLELTEFTDPIVGFFVFVVSPFSFDVQEAIDLNRSCDVRTNQANDFNIRTATLLCNLNRFTDMFLFLMILLDGARKGAIILSSGLCSERTLRPRDETKRPYNRMPQDVDGAGCGQVQENN